MNQKSTGIVRKIDDLGRIVLPVEMRRALEIGVQDCVDIQFNGDSIVLKKHTTSCTFCGATKNLTTFRGKHICPQCLHALQNS